MNRWARTYRSIAIGLGLVGVLGVTACGGSSSSSDEALTFVEGGGSASAFNAPYNSFVTDEFWSPAGLDVETQYTQGATQSCQLVVTGAADLAVVGLASAYSVAAKSPELRIIAVTPNNIYHLTAPTGSDIESAADLRGKTVGVPDLATSAYLYMRAATLAAGVDPDTEVTWLSVGNGAQAAQALESGAVDAFGTYDGQLQVVSSLTSTGLEVVDTPLEDLQGSGAWVTNEKFLTENRDTVVELMRGVSKAAQWTAANPEAVIEHFWSVNPDTKPTDMSDAEAMSSTIEGASPIWKGLMGIGADGTYGIPDPAQLEANIQFHQDGGLVEGELNMDTAFDFSAMEEANDYDKAEVEQEALAAS